MSGQTTTRHGKHLPVLSALALTELLGQLGIRPAVVEQMLNEAFRAGTVTYRGCRVVWAHGDFYTFAICTCERADVSRSGCPVHGVRQPAETARIEA